MELKEENTSYIEYFLPFYILLSQYRIGFLSLAHIGLLIVGIISMNNNGFYIKFNNEIKRYLLFWIGITLMDLVDMLFCFNSSNISNIVEYSLLFFLLFINTQNGIDSDKLYKIWKFASLLYGIGICYHFFKIYFLGQSITTITIIPNYIVRESNLAGVRRPVSFFAEPESFVNSTIPCLILGLNRKDYKFLSFLTFCVLLSTSTTGIFFAAIIWGIHVLKVDLSLIKKIGLVLGVSIALLLFFNLPFFEESINKATNVASGESTFVTRISNGVIFVSKMSPFELILGSTNNDVYSYIHNNYSRYSDIKGIITYYKANHLFINTFGQIVFKYGVVGLLLYLSMYLVPIKKKNFVLKPLVIVSLIGLFAQTSLLNALFFQTQLLLLSFSNELEMTHDDNEVI